MEGPDEKRRLVGENGPEFFIPQKDTYIDPIFMGKGLGRFLAPPLFREAQVYPDLLKATDFLPARTFRGRLIRGFVKGVDLAEDGIGYLRAGFEIAHMIWAGPGE